MLLYDDAGDGYGEGLTIPIRYAVKGRKLTIGRAEGTFRGMMNLLVRFISPDGTEQIRVVLYDGRRTVCTDGEE